MKVKHHLLILAALTLAAQCALAQFTSTTGTNSGLTFQTSAGANPTAQTFSVMASGTPTSGSAPVVTTSTNSGGNWLAVSSNTTGSLNATTTVSVLVDSQFLPAGTYTGQINVSQAGIPGTYMTPVTLTVFGSGLAYGISPTVLNVTAGAGVNAATQSFTVNTVGGAAVTPTITSTTSSGGTFFTTGTPVVNTNGSFSVPVTFNTSTLAQGFYSGVITVSGTGVANAPFNIPVNLKVGTTSQGPSLSVSSSPIVLNAAVGQNPTPVSLAINNGGTGTLSPSLTTTSSAGVSFLTANLGAAMTGGVTTASISANSANLPVGTYTGSVQVTDASNPNSPVTIPVTLNVQAANPTLALSSQNVTLSANNVNKTGSIGVALANTGVGSLNYTATVTSGSNFLTVSPASGNAPGNLILTANAGTLAPGNYTGTVQVVNNNGVTGTQPMNINVNFTVGTATPLINTNGVVNGASFQATQAAPGDIISIFGTNLAAGETGSVYSNGSLPTTSGGVQVTFDGTPGAIYFVNANQINVQVPYSLAGKTSTQVVVTSGGQASASYTLALRQSDPAILSANGAGAILNSSGGPISLNNPVSAGQTVSLYAVGLGAVTSTGTTLTNGQQTPYGSTLYNTSVLASVTVGGIPATVTYSGLAPGYTGLYQVNFVIPAGVSTGNAQVILTINGQSSAPVSLAIK